jgi:hypothetical protein
MKTVPRGLVDAVGAMLDDPVYSDVVFVLPVKDRRTRGLGRARPRRIIFAAKKILQRVEYFDTSECYGHSMSYLGGLQADKIGRCKSVFSSGFAEAALSPVPSALNILSDSISISMVDDDLADRRDHDYYVRIVDNCSWTT